MLPSGHIRFGSPSFPVYGYDLRLLREADGADGRLHLQEPHVSRLTEEISDFLSAQIIGTLIAMAFRWYGYKKWVFPEENARGQRPLNEEEALGHS